MKQHSSATVTTPPVLSLSRAGIGWGLLGVGAFSFTVPFTRIVVADGAMSPLFVGSARAVVAAVLACVALIVTRQRWPRGAQWWRLGVVAGGVVVGFPLLTSYALTTASASHSAVLIALLPAATAVIAVLRGHERPRPPFWVFSGLGAVAAVTFATVHGSAVTGLGWSDVVLFGAVLAAAVGYAEGGLLARELGAWQTISWALIVASPLMIALTVGEVVRHPPHASFAQWSAFAYLGVVSMYLGFFAWYRGLAIGPMAQVSQIQLVQPVLSITWAALLIAESLTLTTVVGGLVIILFAGSAVRTRLRA